MKLSSIRPLIYSRGTGKKRPLHVARWNDDGEERNQHWPSAELNAHNVESSNSAATASSHA
jgi:hypothetical protein